MTINQVRMIRYMIIVSILLVACTSGEDRTGEAGEATGNEVRLSGAQQEAAGIKPGVVTYREVTETIRANGVLEVPPQNMVTISAPMDGFVKHTELLPGTKVRKGALLVTLEHPDYITLQQDYLENKSQLAFLEEEYKRQERLAQEKVNAVKTLQRAKADFHATRAKVAGLHAKLGFLRIDPAKLEKQGISSTIKIVAPVSGYITQVHVNVGAFVHTSDVMFQLVDNSHLHAELMVFEKDLPHIEEGQEMQIVLANDTVVHKATVYLIGKEISAERTVVVHGHFDREDPSMLPGMFIHGAIETQSGKAPTLPAEAFISYEGHDHVFVPSGEGRYMLTEVQKGVCHGGVCAVTFAGKTPDQVVVEGAYALAGLLLNSSD